jgi:hypothetical protein
MNRPEVRIVQNQEIETNQNPNIDNWEAEQLLRKYGYKPENSNTFQQPEQIEQPGMTFEEMIAQEENRRNQERMRMEQQMRGPKPVSFDGRNGYYSQTSYGTDSDSGFSFKIEVTSDMNIPKNY